MSRRIRVHAAALTAAALVLASAAPALAYKDQGLSAAEKHVPVMIDALVLRPLGLVFTIGGAALAVVPTAFVVITRPTDVMKPLEYMVAKPFRYTFMDPLGEHPPTAQLGK
jgi:hypothetical protein